MKPLLAWALQHVVCLQRSRLSPNQQSFTGGSMCLETLCLFASSFPEHLYVFVVLMNGTKVSGGPVKGGSLWERPAKARLKRGPLSGQLPWSWQWEQKTARMMETWPRNLLPPFLLPLTPTPCELLSVDDRWPSVSFTIKPLVPISALQSPMPVVHACAQTHIYASSNFLLTLWRSVSLPSCTLTFLRDQTTKVHHPRCEHHGMKANQCFYTSVHTRVHIDPHTHMRVFPISQLYWQFMLIHWKVKKLSLWHNDAIHKHPNLSLYSGSVLRCKIFHVRTLKHNILNNIHFCWPFVTLLSHFCL